MAKEINPGFHDFGTHFQENFVKILLKDRKFCEQIREVFDIGFLDLSYLQFVAKKIFDYKDKYSEHPTLKSLHSIISTETRKEEKPLQVKIKEYITRHFKDETTLEKIDDEQYIKDKSLDFCKKQKLYSAMERSIELLDNSSFDEISSIINKALSLGMDNEFGYDYLADFEDRFKFKDRDPISTGWTLVDGICRGGLGKGELSVVIAPSGVGKSMVLTHLGAQALKQGKNVIHYTLELADTYVSTRYDSCLTGISLDRVFFKKNQVYESIKELQGRLIVKEYPTKSISPRSLRTHLDRVKNRGIKIDMIIVDYGDLLKSTESHKEKRHELGSIYEELRAIAMDFNVPVVTASQTNRNGLNAEVITMESISEAFNKVFVADFIFSLSRTIEDKGSNQGRVFIAKNRNGCDGIIFPIFMDSSKVLIKVLPPEEGFESKSNEIDEDKLKRIYQLHLENKLKNEN